MRASGTIPHRYDMASFLMEQEMTDGFWKLRSAPVEMEAKVVRASVRNRKNCDWTFAVYIEIRLHQN